MKVEKKLKHFLSISRLNNKTEVWYTVSEKLGSEIQRKKPTNHVLGSISLYSSKFKVIYSGYTVTTQNLGDPRFIS